jgi:cell wall-associated NlpC family hydrolase
LFISLFCALRRYALVPVGLLAIVALVPMSALADDGLALGSTATMTSGESVLLRSTPGYDAPSTTDVASGTQVTIADGPMAASDGSLWYQVDVWGQLGYLPTWAVSGSGAAPVDPAAPADPAVTADPAVQDAAPAVATGTAYIAGTDGDGAECRADASYDATGLATLPEGTVVETTGGAVGDWQPVNCAGSVGFVNVAYISWTPPAVTAAAPVEAAPADGISADGAPATAGARGGRGTGGGSGQAIADFAMQYVGYPYVYAGEGPDAFDCSGFTKWVISNTLGMDISHDTATQYGMGSPVDKGSLQPGDLVFFQNTFEPGISHAGVYIGGGQFVHAENEGTGVKVSDINSDYYTEHWYGGARFV